MEDPSHQNASALFLHQQPSNVQEYAIIYALIYFMLGIKNEKIEFEIKTEKDECKVRITNAKLDPSFREIAEKIAPIGVYATRLERFIKEKQKMESGLVNHALSGALRHILQDYIEHVANLEKDHRKHKLSVQILWCRIQPLFRLASLSSLLTKIEKRKGAEVLNILYSRLDDSVGTLENDMIRYLVKEATMPYLRMLGQWLYRGEVDDTYGEFMVLPNESKESLRKSANIDFWEKKYKKNKEVPRFLSAQTEKILNTGKYLNVIRECDRYIHCPCEKIIRYSDSSRYSEYIEEAHEYASQTLLNYLLKENELLRHLSSMKDYFLHGAGALFTHFLDLADAEIRKPKGAINMRRMESFLEIAFQPGDNPCKENLRCQFSNVDVYTDLTRIAQVKGELGQSRQMNQPLRSGTNANDDNSSQISGISSFTLDYSVKLPLSLVLEPSLKLYKLLFRHLFYMKTIEYDLGALWLRVSRAKIDARLKQAIFATRHRMFAFLQSLQCFSMQEVIEPNWNDMNQKMLEVKTVDQVLKIHGQFLNICQKQCLLTDEKVVKNLYQLLKSCENFSSKDLENVLPEEVESIYKDFDLKIQRFLTLLHELATNDVDHHMSTLIMKINFNEFMASRGGGRGIGRGV